MTRWEVDVDCSGHRLGDLVVRAQQGRDGGGEGRGREGRGFIQSMIPFLVVTTFFFLLASFLPPPGSQLDCFLR